MDCVEPKDMKAKLIALCEDYEGVNFLCGENVKDFHTMRNALLGYLLAPSEPYPEPNAK